MLSLNEVAAHPAALNAIVRHDPAKKGIATVATACGGPINIAYEVYGSGPVHLVWIMGLNAPKIAWHRQIKYFGVDRADRFTALVFDNRGCGDSSIPWAFRYTTSDMAKDALELCDHLGWTAKHQLHVIGISMGGMIAQELAYLAPDRLASLTLQSTAAALVATVPWYQHLSSRAYMMLPKPLAQRLKNSMAILFTQRWLETPDDLGDFPTNADRFVAEELWRMRELKPPAFRGFALQGLAASWHFMGPERLKTIGETVQNVLVCTGNSDAMIGHQHSDVLVAGIRAGGCNVQVRVFEGVGHTLLWEAMDDYNKMVEEFTETSQQMSR